MYLEIKIKKKKNIYVFKFIFCIANGTFYFILTDQTLLPKQFNYSVILRIEKQLKRKSIIYL